MTTTNEVPGRKKASFDFHPFSIQFRANEFLWQLRDKLTIKEKGERERKNDQINSCYATLDSVVWFIKDSIPHVPAYSVVCLCTYCTNKEWTKNKNKNNLFLYKNEMKKRDDDEGRWHCFYFRLNVIFFYSFLLLYKTVEKARSLGCWSRHHHHHGRHHHYHSRAWGFGIVLVRDCRHTTQLPM